MNKEIQWKDVVNNESYQISEFGGLRRVKHGANVKHGKFIRKGLFYELSGGVTKTGGYVVYSLCNGHGVERQYKAHRLVAEAFIGPPPSKEKKFVAHYDGNPKNNHYSNLRWATCKENMADRDRHKKTPRGSLHYKAILNDETAASMREDAKCIKPYGRNIVLSKKYGVSTSTVKRVLLWGFWP